MIRPKCMENSRMVLSTLWNDDKIGQKILPEVFRCKCIPTYYCLIRLFSAKAPAEIL